jgi:hypothetical protein
MVESGNLKENLWKILIKLSFMMLEVSSLDVDLRGYLFPFLNVKIALFLENRIYPIIIILYMIRVDELIAICFFYYYDNL